MKLDSTTVKIKGEEFAVTEIKMKDMMPIMPRLTGSPEEQQAAQVEMMNISISVKGEPVDVMQLGVQAYIKLSRAVMEVNGLSDIEGGKD